MAVADSGHILDDVFHRLSVLYAIVLVNKIQSAKIGKIAVSSRIGQRVPLGKLSNAAVQVLQPVFYFQCAHDANISIFGRLCKLCCYASTHLEKGFEVLAGDIELRRDAAKNLVSGESGHL